MGIGTPSRKSKIERIVFLLNPFQNRPRSGQKQEGLNKLHMIALPASNRGGITRAKRANQQGNKYPKR